MSNISKVIFPWSAKEPGTVEEKEIETCEIQDSISVCIGKKDLPTHTEYNATIYKLLPRYGKNRKNRYRLKLSWRKISDFLVAGQKAIQKLKNATEEDYRLEKTLDPIEFREGDYITVTLYQKGTQFRCVSGNYIQNSKGDWELHVQSQFLWMRVSVFGELLQELKRYSTFKPPNASQKNYHILHFGVSWDPRVTLG